MTTDTGETTAIKCVIVGDGAVGKYNYLTLDINYE